MSCNDNIRQTFAKRRSRALKVPQETRTRHSAKWRIIILQRVTRRAIAAHNPLPFLYLSASRTRNHQPLPLNADRNFPWSYPRDSSFATSPPRRLASPRPHLVFLIHPRRICSHQAHTYITVAFPMYSSSRTALLFYLNLSRARSREYRPTRCRPLLAVQKIYKSPSLHFSDLSLLSELSYSSIPPSIPPAISDKLYNFIGGSTS